MKKFLVISAAMMMVLTMVSGAMAQSPTTLDVGVSANVKTNCVVTGGTLAFGDIDADGLDKTVSAAGISIKCTKGTIVAVSDNDGVRTNNTMKNTLTTDTLAYTTAYTASLLGGGTGGSGTELATALDFKGTVLAAAAEGVPAGIYEDTIELTLTY
jgi:spore coat protein U-like protein